MWPRRQKDLFRGSADYQQMISLYFRRSIQNSRRKDIFHFRIIRDIYPAELRMTYPIEELNTIGTSHCLKKQGFDKAMSEVIESNIDHLQDDGEILQIRKSSAYSSYLFFLFVQWKEF